MADLLIGSAGGVGVSSGGFYAQGARDPMPLSRVITWTANEFSIWNENFTRQYIYTGAGFLYSRDFSNSLNVIDGTYTFIRVLNSSGQTIQFVQNTSQPLSSFSSPFELERMWLGNDVMAGADGGDTFFGSLGDDQIRGAGGADNMFGQDGDDTLVVYEPGDLVSGEIIDGGANTDRLFIDGGGTFDFRNNIILRSMERLWLAGSDGRLIKFNAIDALGFAEIHIPLNPFATFEVTMGAITTFNASLITLTGAGARFAFRLVGDGDGETMTGSARNDELQGNGGNDSLTGGDGSDQLDGGANDDQLFGGLAGDFLFGREGADLLLGGEGDDTLTGGAGADTVRGEAGDDIVGLDGSADLAAGDVIDGGSGRDRVVFGANGTFDLRPLTVTSIEQLDFLQTTSTLWNAEQLASVTFLRVQTGSVDIAVTMGTATTFSASGWGFSQGFAGNFLRVVGDGDGETITGSSRNDDLRSEDGADIVNGGAGADVLVGGRGGDTVNGEAGDDEIVLSAPDHLDLAERLNGGADTDTLSFATVGDYDFRAAADADVTGIERLLFRGTSGATTARFQASDLFGLTSVSTEGGAVALTVAMDNETFFDLAAWVITGAVAPNGATFITVTGDSDGEAIFVSSERDRVDAGGGADTIVGGGGVDTLNGEGGDDLIFGGAFDVNGAFAANSGVDTANGGANNDKIWGMDGEDVLLGAAGDDFLTGGVGDDILSGGTENDFLFGGDFVGGGFGIGSGADTMDGGDGRDALYGFDGNDTINTGIGDDYVEGGDGADTITGGSGNSFIFGDGSVAGPGGDDLIAAGAGFDYIYGGAGSDTIVFRAGDSFDSVFEFTTADKIRLDPALGITTFAQFQAAIVDRTFNGAAATELTRFTNGAFDQLLIFGVAPSQWTAGMVEFG